MPQQGMHTLPLYYCCMTPYDAKFEGLHILFDKENVADTNWRVCRPAGAFAAPSLPKRRNTLM